MEHHTVTGPPWGYPTLTGGDIHPDPGEYRGRPQLLNRATRSLKGIPWIFLNFSFRTQKILLYHFGKLGKIGVSPFTVFEELTCPGYGPARYEDLTCPGTRPGESPLIPIVRCIPCVPKKSKQ